MAMLVITRDIMISPLLAELPTVMALYYTSYVCNYWNYPIYGMHNPIYNQLELIVMAISLYN